MSGVNKINDVMRIENEDDKKSDGEYPGPENSHDSDGTGDTAGSERGTSNRSIASLSPKMSPVKAGFLGLFGGFLVYQVFASILTITILGTDLSKHDMESARLLQMAAQILFLLLPALIFSKIIYEKVGLVIRFRLPEWKGLLLFSAGAFAIIPLLETLIELQVWTFNHLAKSEFIFRQLKSLFDLLDKLLQETYVNFFRANNFFDGIIIVLVVAFSPAICEEVMFRGFIQTSFHLKYRPFLAILITSVFFAVFHLNPYGTLSLILLSMYLGYAVYKTDSILTGVVIHFINNLFAVVAVFVFGTNELISSTGNSAEPLNSILLRLSYFGILALIPVIVIMLYYRNKNRKAV